MYTSNVLVAVSEEFSALVERELKGLEYVKTVKNSNSYFKLSNVSWNEGFEPFVDEFLELLASIPDGRVVYIRVGQDLEDIEVVGQIQNFNITIERSIKY